jgi:hypothetical protein
VQEQGGWQRAPHLDPLRLRIDKTARRSADDAGRVEDVDEARQQLAAAG